jgi:aspartate ammonia-lyase
MTEQQSESLIKTVLFDPLLRQPNRYHGFNTSQFRQHLYALGTAPQPTILKATVLVKKAIAQTNQELARLEPAIYYAIIQSCNEALAELWQSEFVLELTESPLQAAFEESVSEILANRAEELAGGVPGQNHLVKPEHFLLSGQSAAASKALASQLAVILSLNAFQAAGLDLERLLRRRALEFAHSARVTTDRTNQEHFTRWEHMFNAFGSGVERLSKLVKEASFCLNDMIPGSKSGDIKSGASAAQLVQHLAISSGLKLNLGSDNRSFHESVTDLLRLSSCLKDLAVELGKIGRDLQMISATARTLEMETEVDQWSDTRKMFILNNAESKGSQNQLADSLYLLAAQVIGLDLSTSLAGQAHASAGAPLILSNLLETIHLLHLAVLCFTKTSGSSNQLFEQSKVTKESDNSLFSLLSEHLGFELARRLYEEFAGSSKEIRQALSETGMVPKEVIEKIARHDPISD